MDRDFFIGLLFIVVLVYAVYKIQISNASDRLKGSIFILFISIIIAMVAHTCNTHSNRPNRLHIYK